MESVDKPGSDRSVAPDDKPAVREWSPSGVVSTMWITLGILLGLFALFLFGLLYSLIGAQSETEGPAFDWLATAILTGILLVAHQLIHGAVSRLFGGRPRFDLDVIQWVLPAIYCRVDGQEFTRVQYLVYALAPLIFSSVLLVVLMPVLTQSAMLILPLAVNAGFSIRDIWTARVVWMQPKGSIVEVRRNGLRLIRMQ